MMSTCKFNKKNQYEPDIDSSSTLTLFIKTVELFRYVFVKL